MKVMTKPAMMLGGIAMVAGTLAGPASAATNAYNPIALCNTAYGTGFAVKHIMTLRAPDTRTVGVGYLMHNAGNGYDCAVTINSEPGTAVPLAAGLRGSGGIWHIDRGDYRYYAGPVGIPATAGECVQWLAMARGISRTENSCG